MHSKRVAAFLLFFSLKVFAQGDLGTITGSVMDPAGAVVAGAPIEVRNVDTGAMYQVGSSATGNYVVQVPTGTYELSVTAPGFKKFVRQNIAVPVAQTLRIDVSLEVGSNTESVTVTEAAPLLKTESGELAHNVTSDALDTLPVLGIGTAAVGATGIRSPYSVMNLVPGAVWQADNTIRLNGMEGNTSALRVDGQDATGTISNGQTSQTEPSVEAIQEVSVQQSNFAAEFGQAGSGLFNFTMKSGTNQFHGSAYDYFVNEFLNAGTPFTNDGNGHLLRPRQRRNDYGMSLGGPVEIPRVYNGHDKTFFFFNWEQFREKDVINNFPTTVPTLAYRQGNFQQALTGRSLGTDGLGRPIMENEIYDPKTLRLVNSVPYTDPYPNNIIPASDLDAVALKIQSYIPLPQNSALVNNYTPVYTNPRYTEIPSIKIDHSISARAKLSGFWSRTQTDSPNNSGLPYPIEVTVGSHITADTIRVNLDYTITPTVLFHVGAGFIDNRQNPEVPRFDDSLIGFQGTNTNLFPYFSVLQEGGGQTGSGGGMTNFGPPSDFIIKNYKPTGTVSTTWVRNNHTYKFGGEVIVNGYPSFSETYSAGNMLFSPTETGLPALNGVSLPASTGFNYASFMIGAPNTGYDSVPAALRTGQHSLAGFAEDSWKVTRKFTLDYGLRYDFQTYLKEHDGYMFDVSVSTPNPAVGGRLGAIIFEGYGPGRCNCEFAHNYPYAFGPRLGGAYQITPKTVLRIGGGISYSKTNNDASKASNFGSTRPFAGPAYGVPPFTLAGGMPYQITFPDFYAGQQPFPGTIGNPTNMVDRNAGRPARITQWSAGLQREITSNLMVEASYVGNRGVWWAAQTLSPYASDAIPPSTFAAWGLNLNNAADRALLASPISSPIAAARGFSGLPYPGFPTGLTVAQALRPLPQFNGVVQTWTPLGDTWYDALQAKVIKRLSHGLDMQVAYTWSKSLDIGSEENNNYGSLTTPVINNVFNRGVNKTFSGFDQPQSVIISGNYTTPKLFAQASGFGHKVLSMIARDWTLGTVLHYASGFLIKVPVATTGLATYDFQSTNVDRVPGVPLFIQNLNCHCFDPNTTFVLNPNAWVNPPLGQFGTANAHYSDYRNQRHPAEAGSFGRVFRIKERATLQIRAEFTNIFNRTGLNPPTSTNAFATQTRNAQGQATGGFGWINPAAVGAAASNPAAASTATFATPPPRQGQLVARFQF
jgi:Carboxypeptidase regulatory-like domain/TonB dependent receptor